ncbi:hypothetical protein ACFY5D_16660 [Paeniglutamicibacter sp. NPDC012692]|uniref:hypothetical protein n=1 Tax=Paeniglutamicibacter sp. NPDC012692 TaxID=3364388 RepID=UPI0036CF2167
MAKTQTLVKGDHKITTSLPAEAVKLRSLGYADYVAPKAPKAVKPEATEPTKTPAKS